MIMQHCEYFKHYFPYTFKACDLSHDELLLEIFIDDFEKTSKSPPKRAYDQTIKTSEFMPELWFSELLVA